MAWEWGRRFGRADREAEADRKRYWAQKERRREGLRERLSKQADQQQQPRERVNAEGVDSIERVNEWTQRSGEVSLTRLAVGGRREEKRAKEKRANKRGKKAPWNRAHGGRRGRRVSPDDLRGQAEGKARAVFGCSALARVGPPLCPFQAGQRALEASHLGCDQGRRRWGDGIGACLSDVAVAVAVAFGLWPWTAGAAAGTWPSWRAGRGLAAGGTVCDAVAVAQRCRPERRVVSYSRESRRQDFSQGGEPRATGHQATGQPRRAKATVGRPASGAPGDSNDLVFVVPAQIHRMMSLLSATSADFGAPYSSAPLSRDKGCRRRPPPLFPTSTPSMLIFPGRSSAITTATQTRLLRQ